MHLFVIRKIRHSLNRSSPQKQKKKREQPISRSRFPFHAKLMLMDSAQCLRGHQLVQ